MNMIQLLLLFIEKLRRHVLIHSVFTLKLCLRDARWTAFPHDSRLSDNNNCKSIGVKCTFCGWIYFHADRITAVGGMSSWCHSRVFEFPFNAIQDFYSYLCMINVGKIVQTAVRFILKCYDYLFSNSFSIHVIGQFCQRNIK